MDVSVIVTDIHITFQTPARYEDHIEVGVRTSKIGNKSMTVEQYLMNADTGEVPAAGTVILAMYDYREHRTISVPGEKDEWWKNLAKEFNL
jgi:acyl-CoA thioesterase FadM